MRLLLCAALFAALAPATVDAQADWAAGIGDRVVERVAEAWLVPGEEIVLEWGVYHGEAPGKDAPLQLLGSGAGGHWVVRFDLWNGQSASVRLRAGRSVSRPVATRRLSRGEILTASDIRLESTVVWDGPHEDEAAVQEGWEVQRVVDEGDRLGTPAVRPPHAVVLGSAVTLVWTRGSITLSVPGKAAGSAALGDAVLVRTDSGARIRGLAIAPGVVDISRDVQRTATGRSR